MEPMGAISELTWNISDESEVILAQLLGAYPDMNEQDQEASFGVEAMFWPDQGASSSTLLDNLSSCWPSTSNNTVNTSSFFFPTSEFQSYEMGDLSAVSANSMDCFTSEEQMTGSSLMVEDLICSKDDENELKDNVGSTTAEAVAVADVISQAKRKLLEPRNDNKDEVIPTERPKKKSRASVQVQKNAKNTRSKKAQKNAGTGEEALSNANCSSEDESSTSQELNEGASSSSKGKTRAGHGSATDPQSLYARKRRGRINERLRILQNLVPNGTKVDISTMLEEAVQYVKFLQLQIKILSSDDLWMYAPLAYNGMDIGLDLKIPLPQQ